MQLKKAVFFVSALLVLLFTFFQYWIEISELVTPYPKLSSEWIAIDIGVINLKENELNDPQFAVKRFEKRRERLERFCEIGYLHGVWSKEDKIKYSTEWIPNENFVVSPQNNFLFCTVPKSGSNSWHTVAYNYNNPHTNKTFTTLQRNRNNQMALDLDPQRGRCLVTRDNAFRGIPVKHPFRRLISAWHQKLRRNDDMYKMFLLEAFPHMKSYVSEKDADHIISFPDFMRYIARYGHDPQNLDYHFLSVEYLCKPCLYPYNFVVKMESLEHDENYLVKRLGIEKIPVDGKGTKYLNRKVEKPEDIIKFYFRQVDQSTVKRLMDLYFYDFATAGYTFDVDTSTAGGFYS